MLRKKATPCVFRALCYHYFCCSNRVLVRITTLLGSTRYVSFHRQTTLRVLGETSPECQQSGPLADGHIHRAFLAAHVRMTARATARHSCPVSCGETCLVLCGGRVFPGLKQHSPVVFRPVLPVVHVTQQQQQ